MNSLTKTQPFNKGLLQARHIQHRLKAALKPVATIVLPAKEEAHFE